MKIQNKHYRTIYFSEGQVKMIEQNHLPFKLSWFTSDSYTDTCHAIKTMIIRGAGAIGAAAGYAMAQAALEAPGDKYEEFLLKARYDIESTRPTARNLFYATEKVFRTALRSRDEAVTEAEKLADENAEEGRLIGEYGNELIESGFRILTHCNAGWLAFVDYGSAIAPIYAAHDAGKDVFVYADETRPRSQGGRLTAWELKNHDVPHVVIPDNAAAYLMAQKKINMVIVGADRIAANGDVANKIGTLEKAIAADYYGIPFYVAAPCSTIDIQTETGAHIKIEERSEEEVMYQWGKDDEGNIKKVSVNNPDSRAVNPAFDVSPASLVKGIITEKGIINADSESIHNLLINE